MKRLSGYALRWKDEYDDVLINLHGLGLTDYEILARMLGQELAVAYSDIIKARQRLRLRSNKMQTTKAEAVGRMAKERPDPLALAQLYLRGFDRLTMTIQENGRRQAIGLNDAMRRTNAVMKAYGLPMVDANPKWVEGL